VTNAVTIIIHKPRGRDQQNGLGQWTKVQTAKRDYFTSSIVDSNRTINTPNAENEQLVHLGNFATAKKTRFQMYVEYVLDNRLPFFTRPQRVPKTNSPGTCLN